MSSPEDAGSLLADDIDVYDPGLYQRGEPHAAWAALRRRAPVTRHRSDGGTPFWSVTRYAECTRALMDPEVFSSSSGTMLAVVDGDAASGQTILLTDPPEHTYLKSPIARLMSRHTAPGLVADITANVRGLVEPCLAGGRHDFARLIAPLPMAAVGHLLGVPPGLWAEVARWTMTGLAPEDPAYAAGSPAETLRLAHHELFALFTGLIEERRESAADDLISALCALDFGGRKLTAEEVLLNCYTLAMGTNSTTPHVAGQLMLVLAEQPEVWRRLRAEPALVPTAVEELLRWATPTNHLLRRATRDTELGGVQIAAGDAVCLWIASANRDEDVFDRPFRFDPSRRPNPHIAFGLGTHYCTGARAARLVLTVLLTYLLEHFERFELVEEPRHLRSNFVNGLSSLIVEAFPLERPGERIPVPAAGIAARGGSR